MTAAHPAMTSAEAPPPRWDGHRLLFDLPLEGGGQVRCAISRLALLAVSGGGSLRTMDLLRRFAAARPRIEAAAQARLRERAGPPLGLLHIWEEDVTDPSPAAPTVSRTATAPRG
ncbi:DUF1488 family protein [Roseomonas sp. HF4]|uniref:DUF1488 family protein n=1 Tax=Roseomonas sp. HF4 TaxID=2562313 RepID=UPI0010BFCAAE|nr:DUF1488 family protein [Roseomonas sp. HF4]